VAVAEFSDEVCTLGALATGGATKYENNLGVSWQFNSGYWYILASNLPNSVDILRAINLDDDFPLLVELYDWL